MIPLLVACGIIQSAYPDCNDTRVKSGPGTDAGTCATCAGTGNPIQYPTGGVCNYLAWGDEYECGPQGTGETPTGNVCSCEVENRIVKLYQGTCNGQGACSNGQYVLTLPETKPVNSAILTSC